jgi:sugar O-acyltransferase (sialic acid O-acetyltransferase NeuD family)
MGIEALWVASEMNRDGAVWRILGFCDDNPERRGTEIEGVPVLGPPDQVVRDVGDEVSFHCAIGRNRLREKVVQRVLNHGWKPATLIHPSVIRAPRVKIGEGCYIGAGSVLAPNSTIGAYVLINTLAGIGHHSEIGDYAQICPGARVSGYCKVDKYAFLGSNSSIQPGVTIGEGACVGANSYAIRSVAPFVTVTGVPARIVGGPAKNESPA